MKSLKLKETVKWLIKAVVACVIAFAIVTGCSAFYYNIPVHFKNTTGATDYKWESRRYSRCLEGFSFGKINNDGFNNLDDLGDKRIDILFMGSSHGEAFNVLPENSCAAQMNKMLDGEKYVYNIATAGHTLSHLCRNLNNALDTYKPAEYVILECPNVVLKEKNLAEAVDGTLPVIKSETGFLISILQKNPYLRLLYSQFTNVKASKTDDQENVSAPATVLKDNGNYYDTLKRFIDKIKTDSNNHNVTPIIVYHPQLGINEDGSVQLLHSDNEIKKFADICQQSGVFFVDMSEDFVNGYEKNHKLPYGFNNTVAGEGHLNAYGHNLIAKKLLEVIKDGEAAK